MRFTTTLLLVTAVTASGCSSDSNNTPTGDGNVGAKDTGGGGGDGGPPTGKELSFVKKALDVDRAGEQTAIASSGSVVGIAYYRVLLEPQWPTVECPATFSGGGGQKARPGHDVYYVESPDNGVNWDPPVKVAQTINNPFGISIVKGGGQTHIGYLGGEMSLQECASSDAAIASSSDGKSWSTQIVNTAGPIGDTVGHWISVAIDGSGQVQAAYRDVGFGLYEQIGHQKSEVRYGSAGDPVHEDTGGGIYSTLKFDGQGNPVIMHFNAVQTDGRGGIQLAVRQGSSWATQQLVPGGTAERPDLDTDGNGRWGLAYFEPGKSSLLYIQSDDMKTWTPAVTVDLSTTRNGEYASLAYDSAGNPGISYYRCGPAGQSNCDAVSDALMFAYRIDGKWKTYEVDTGDTYACGDHTSLTFTDDDTPVISYRCVTLQNQNNDFVDTLKVARGVWK